MGGDLNLKKSFHPALMRNQIRVAQEEKKALDERKKTDQRLRELKEERAREDIQRRLEESGARVSRVDRNLSWMYETKQEGAAGTTEELEGFLLGKRRIDSILAKGGEQEKLDRNSGVGVPGGSAAAAADQPLNSARDTAAKIREDPLLAIKKQEQALYEAVMNDPIKRRQLLARMDIADEKEKEKSRRREDKEERRRHRHHHHRRRHRSPDDNEADDGEHKSSRRRRSDSEDRSRSPRRYNSDQERERTWRRRRESDDGRRSDRRRENDRMDDSRRGDDRRDRDGDRDRSASRGRRRMDRSRSRTPPPPPRRRTPEESANGRRDNRDKYRGRSPRNGYAPSRRSPDRYDARPRPNGKQQQGSDEAERARKLAAMEAAASDMDVDRERRLAAVDEAEQAARVADERAREQFARYGDRSFISGLHRQAGERKLANRADGRGRQDAGEAD